MFLLDFLLARPLRSWGYPNLPQSQEVRDMGFGETILAHTLHLSQSLTTLAVSVGPLVSLQASPQRYPQKQPHPYVVNKWPVWGACRFLIVLQTV